MDIPVYRNVFAVSILILLSSKQFQAQTIYSVKDGYWEWPSTWSNPQAISSSLDGDTIFIAHHITYYNPVQLSNCYIHIYHGGGMCGHSNVYLHHSYVLNNGYFDADYLLIDSSQWNCDGGLWTMEYDITGNNAVFNTGNCYGDSTWRFICLDVDTTQTDTIIIPTPPQIPPPSFSIYPNPTFDNFTVDAEIPDSSMQVVLNICDLLGRKMNMVSVPVGKTKLIVSAGNWSAGMYFLRFEDGDKTLYRQKMIRVK